MRKTLTAIVLSAALGMSALAGCGSKRETDPRAVTGRTVIKVPQHPGEMIYAGRTNVGSNYVVFSNGDGTITAYSGDEGDWHRFDYEKSENKGGNK